MKRLKHSQFLLSLTLSQRGGAAGPPLINTGEKALKTRLKKKVCNIFLPSETPGFHDIYKFQFKKACGMYLNIFSSNTLFQFIVKNL